VIVKKTLGGAVVRQKSRRQLRAIISLFMKKHPQFAGSYAVVIRSVVPYSVYETNFNQLIERLAHENPSQL
jgi:ribonuclease P protein component